MGAGSVGRLTPHAAAWLVALVAFAVMMPFAAVHDTFPGDIWLTERLQDADGEAVDRLLGWGSRLLE